MAQATLHLPAPGVLVRHALPQLLENTVAPVAVFYGILSLLGLRGALLATLAWFYLALARRVVTRRHVPGMLVVGAALLTVRTAAALATGNAFVYFLQPTVGTFLVAGAFLVSIPAGKPLTERLARDFCPLDPEIFKRPGVRQFFLRLSLLWTFVFFANATVGLWLLLSQSVGAFVLLKTTITVLAIGAAIAVSTLWFRRTLRGEGIALRWSVLSRTTPTPAMEAQ